VKSPPLRSKGIESLPLLRGGYEPLQLEGWSHQATH